MGFAVVYKNTATGKLMPVKMGKSDKPSKARLPDKAKIAVIDEDTGKVVENVTTAEVDGDIVITAQQNGQTGVVVIEDGRNSGAVLLDNAGVASEFGRDYGPLIAEISGSGLASMAPFYIAGAAGLAGGGFALIQSSDTTPPVFSSGSTGKTLAENTAAGAEVYTAQASDNNGKGKVTYALKQGSDAGLAIDSATGKVTLAAKPDYETKTAYNFVVVATDAAGNTAEQAVSVAVTNLDEAAPTISSGATAAAIAEGSGAGQVVYTATGTDADFAAPATASSITWSLKSGSDAGLAINAQTGAVTLAANPDFEAKASYSFTVVATDAAGNASEKAVTLAVANRDEVAPTISSNDEVTPIPENYGDRKRVYTATAEDTDFIAPATASSITWSLKSNSDAGFSIEADTGRVYRLAHMSAYDADYETKSSYQFTVVATDAAGNSSEKTLTMAVVNKDDQAPTITSPDNYSLDENSGPGYVVYVAEGFDTDFIAPATASSVTYSLKPGSDAGLTIDAQTGAVTLADNPDYETKSSYNFTVVATDAAYNASEKAVTVGIIDINEGSGGSGGNGGTGGGASRLVFAMSEGYPDLVDGGNGVFDGWADLDWPQGDDVFYSTTPGDPGYIDFANMAVDIHVLGLSILTPLNINGFGADDRIEIFLSTMENPLGPVWTPNSMINGPYSAYTGNIATRGFSGMTFDVGSIARQLRISVNESALAWRHATQGGGTDMARFANIFTFSHYAALEFVAVNTVVHWPALTLA